MLMYSQSLLDYLAFKDVNMKRFSLVIIVLCSIFLCACSGLEITGLDNFREETCSVGLTDNLFPTDEFIELFAFEDGDYFFVEDADILWGKVTVFSYLHYTPEIYSDAKNYCLNNWSFCEDHQYELGDYHFIEHPSLRGQSFSEITPLKCDYPKSFNMFGYNDETHTLIFLGYYNGNPEDPSKTAAETDFKTFLSENYSTFFDFWG